MIVIVLVLPAFTVVVLPGVPPILALIISPEFQASCWRLSLESPLLLLSLPFDQVFQPSLPVSFQPLDRF